MLDEFCYEVDLADNNFEQVDICQCRFRSTPWQGDDDVSAICLVGTELCSDDTDVVVFGDDGFLSVVDFCAELVEKGMADIEGVEYFGVTGPAVSVFVTNSEDYAGFREDIKDLAGNLLAENTARSEERTECIHRNISLRELISTTTNKDSVKAGADLYSGQARGEIRAEKRQG